MTPSTDDRLVTDGAWKEYRLPNATLIGSVIGSVVSLSLALIMMLIVFSNDFTYLEGTCFALFVGFMLFMTVVCLWGILAYFRQRLCINQEAIRSIGCFRSRTTQLVAVVQAKWRPDPGGCVVLYSPRGKHVVNFSLYAASDRAELIAFFRSKLPKTVHVDWRDFESVCAGFETSRVYDKWMRRFMVLVTIFLVANGLFWIVRGVWTGFWLLVIGGTISFVILAYYWAVELRRRRELKHLARTAPTAGGQNLP